MGTQQILLIILGVIVVGTAVVIAILVFGTNADQANKDALTQDCLLVASAAQGYFRTPTLLGGGNNSFDGIRITDCGMEDNGTGAAENLSGVYTITVADGDRFTVRGVSASNPVNMVSVTVDMTKTLEHERITVSYEGW